MADVIHILVDRLLKSLHTCLPYVINIWYDAQIKAHLSKHLSKTSK